jgi:hypothetical protein
MSLQITKEQIDIKNELTNHDVGIFGKQLIESDTVNEARSAIGVGRKNLIINGNFDIWQRGIVSVSNSYTADHWYIDQNSNASQSSNVPDGSNYSLKVIPDSGFSASCYTTIELMNATNNNPLKINTDYTISFYVKSKLGNQFNVRTNFRNSIGSTTNEVVVLPESKGIVCSGGWDYASLTYNSGSSLRHPLNNFLELLFLMVSPDIQFEIAQVQLEEGSVATEFEQRSIGEELELCQRYYQKSYNLDDAPGTITTEGIVAELNVRNSLGNTPGCVFNTTMRTAPTITTYSYLNNTPNVVDNSGNIPASANNINESGFAGVTLTGATTNKVAYHYTADAEI